MLRDTYNKLREILADADIEAPEVEARLLIENITGLSRAMQIAKADEEIGAEQEKALLETAEKRARHIPLQYILGKWSFMGIELKVGEGVLIPRDDTEVLVNLCLEYLKDIEHPQVIDLCAGSGAISIALDKLTDAEVTAVELSDTAFNFLLENIKSNDSGVKAIKADVLEDYISFEEECFDLIVSNPPYIKSNEINSLQEEVRYEPRMALDGGADGCDFYRAIIKRWTRHLKKGGALAFELGEDQAEYVGSLTEQNGFKNIKTAEDLGGIKRAIIGTKQ